MTPQTVKTFLGSVYWAQFVGKRKLSKIYNGSISLRLRSALSLISHCDPLPDPLTAPLDLLVIYSMVIYPNYYELSIA